MVSKKEQSGKCNSSKYFIGYNGDGIIRPLYLFISETNGYINKFDKKKKEKVPHKCLCLSIIILDSVIYTFEKYHPQISLEECKYVKKKMKTKNYIDNELESKSDIEG